jgi:molybdopterin converting factor small subunit
MIFVRCFGHIKTSIGSKEITLESSDLDAAELVDRVRSLSVEPDPGFNKYNTLVMVEDGEAFVPAGAKRTVRGGERVALIPFSHGG